MDKRFFLALFLSLIVIAASQLLFPPAKPVPRSAVPKDSSSALRGTASSTQPAVTQLPATVSSQPRAIITGSSTAAAATAVTPEATTVSTPKAIYRFSNLGAAPVSVVMQDYKNQSAFGGLVDLAVAGSPLFGYRLVTPTDTLDLSQVPFSLSRARNANGDEILTYSAVVKSLPVSIAYSIPKDTSASYVIHMDGHVEGVQGQSYLVTEIPKTLQPTEVDTVGDSSKSGLQLQATT